MLSPLKPLSPVVPVFVLIAIGFVFARYKKISLDPITEIVIYLGAPCLVFTSLATKPLFAADIAVILAGAVGIIAGVGLLIWLYALLTDFSSTGLTLPVLFMNAGNMGIPLSLFAFGEPGLQRGTLFYVMITLMHNSLGLYLLGGKGGAREIFRLPLIYAAVLGLLFNLAKIPIPEPIFQPLSILGMSVIPLMLVSLGYRLYTMPSLTWGHSFAGALIRVIGGFASAYPDGRIAGHPWNQPSDHPALRFSAFGGDQLHAHREIQPRPGAGGLDHSILHRFVGDRRAARLVACPLAVKSFLTIVSARYSFRFALRLQGSPVQIRRGPATVMATKAAS
jgi:predicted permease